MREDAFERAAQYEARSSETARRRVTGSFVRMSTLGELLALGLVCAFVPGRQVSPIVLLLGVGVFVAWRMLIRYGPLSLPPMWEESAREQWEVTRALMSGRAVRDPALAGLAVAEAAYQRRHWWVIWLMVLIEPLSLVFVIGLVSPWCTAAVLCATGAPLVWGSLQAPRAELANRRLLDA